MHPSNYLQRPLPKALQRLVDLALDLRGVRHHGTEALWQTLDPKLWEATSNPWLILQSVSTKRLAALAQDGEFLKALERQTKARDDYLRKSRWFGDTCRADGMGMVAYFSMEFGLSEALPIYSGGLGILAGDHMKAVSDLGVPLVGVGLLYQQGYFRQALDAEGNQLAFFPYNAPGMLPVMPLRNADGEWLRVSVELPGRTVSLRAWQAHVGRAMLFLLDSNDAMNSPGDRAITSELYGGGQEMRMQQEIALGIGGWRLMEALAMNVEVCHLNEGHAAFAVIERARSHMARTRQPFPVALASTRAGNLFTTHTPVEAGFDRFPPALFAQYFQDYAERLGVPLAQLLALGRAHGDDSAEPFNMAYLALRGVAAVNGVSRLHGEVSRRIFAPLFPRWPVSEVPVGPVTNGVHVPSWDSAAADALWTESCGATRWYGDLKTLEQDLKQAGDEVLWSLREGARGRLIETLRRRVARTLATQGADSGRIAECANWLDPKALTLGFARRFATYKRPNLLLHDPERLVRLLTDAARPLRLVIAGKAHPQDEAGKAMVRAWLEFLRRPEVCGRAVFVEDYDMGLAQELVQGVDVWLNTPRRPWEASGTSGMKVLANGGLNLSELDGWWAEAYDAEVGWALGDGHEHGDDPAWDAAEADALYRILEQSVLPAFYERDARGIPTAWVARMRESMARLTPRFSTNRMVRDYTEHHYLPLAEGYRRRSADDGALAARLVADQRALDSHFSGLAFGIFTVQETAGVCSFQVEVFLGDLTPEQVRVELYADPLAGEDAERHPMQPGPAPNGPHQARLYSVRIPCARPAADFTPRIMPQHAQAAVPLELSHILWRG